MNIHTVIGTPAVIGSLNQFVKKLDIKLKVEIKFSGLAFSKIKNLGPSISQSEVCRVI